MRQQPGDGRHRQKLQRTHDDDAELRAFDLKAKQIDAERDQRRW